MKMNMWWLLQQVLFCAIFAVKSAKSADFELCTKGDNKVCLLKAANFLYGNAIAGNKSLNMESLDPMHHEAVDGDIPSLKYRLTNSTIQGFKDCKVVDFDLSEDEKTYHWELHCPFFSVHGTYEIDGNILALPIKGNGDYNMECKEYHVVLDSEFKLNEIDGKKYFSIKTYKYSGALKGGMIDMKNLFNGQKELADSVLKVMNENWVTVATELQGPVFKAILQKIVKNYNKYFKSQAISTFYA